MRIYVVNVRRLLFYLLIFLIVVFLLSAISLKGMQALGVFSEKRELPVYSVDTPDKVVSITFDCAWGADDIPEILDKLRDANVKATFFIVGQWAGKYPDKVRMIAQDGHDVANHSYSHLHMNGLGNSRNTSEIKKCGVLLEQLSGTKCELFRAPYGEYNDSLVKCAKQLGYYTIQWDVDSLDWSPDISKDEILRRIDSKAKNGSIMLFHNDTPYTAKILPSVITNLKSSGYSFLPVSRMIMRDNYIIDHEGRQKPVERLD